MTAIAECIGRRIKNFRKMAGRTQEDLAQASGISVSFMSMIERGERLAHLSTLQDLAAGLRVSFAELVADPGKPDSDTSGLVCDFITARRMTKPEVEKLLDVAKVMFPADRSVAP